MLFVSKHFSAGEKKIFFSDTHTESKWMLLVTIDLAWVYQSLELLHFISLNREKRNTDVSKLFAAILHQISEMRNTNEKNPLVFYSMNPDEWKEIQLRKKKGDIVYTWQKSVMPAVVSATSCGRKRCFTFLPIYFNILFSFLMIKYGKCTQMV